MRLTEGPTERRLQEPPGLTALVVYLRPCERASLLSSMADLGVFVVECAGHPLASFEAARHSFDMVVLVADESSESVALVRRWSGHSAPPIIVLSDSEAEGRSFLKAGAFAATTLSSQRASLAAMLGTASVGRSRRDGATGSPSQQHKFFTVFRDVSFNTRPPELGRDGNFVNLSAVEAELLTLLAASIGVPVANSEIESRIFGDRSAIGRGYLKTVILRIRRKVKTIGGDPSNLVSVRGFGYVLTD